MPKILRIHNRLIVGGPTLNVLNLTKYLQPDFETLLIVGEKDGHEKDMTPLANTLGITPLVVPEMGRSINPLKDYSTYKKLKSIIKDFKPDIVHTHGAKPGAVGRVAAANSKVPVIVHTYHGHIFHSYFNKAKTQVYLNIERALSWRTDALIAISPQQKKELSEQYKVAGPAKFHTIPLGFDLGSFVTNQPEKRKKFRSEFMVADDEVAIGITGRLVPVKHHELFLNALSSVINNTTKKVKAFIIGDGHTREMLITMAKQLNISINVPGEVINPANMLTFTSWRSDIDVINAGLDIVCLTSLNEGTPVSLIEAQAASKPVVSTMVGGIKDIVQDGKTGLLSAIKDKDGFYKNLLLLVEDDNLRMQLGSNGASWITEKYSVHRLATDVRNLYYRLLERKKV